MRKVLISAITISLGIMLINCGSPKADMDEIPDWYLNPPQTQDAIYEAGDAAKYNIDQAKAAADARARDAIFRIIEIEICSNRPWIELQYINNKAVEKNEKLYESIASDVVDSLKKDPDKYPKIIRRSVEVTENLFHAYSLARYNWDSLNNIYHKVLKNHKEPIHNIR